MKRLLVVHEVEYFTETASESLGKKSIRVSESNYPLLNPHGNMVIAVGKNKHHLIDPDEIIGNGSGSPRWLFEKT